MGQQELEHGVYEVSFVNLAGSNKCAIDEYGC